MVSQMFSVDDASRIIELTSNSKTYPEQLSALASLLASYKPSRYLEIGAFEGRSLGLFSMLSSSLYDSKLHITSVDSWQGGDEHKVSGFDMQEPGLCRKVSDRPSLGSDLFLKAGGC